MKGLLVKEDVIIIGTDTGEIKVFDKHTLKVLCEEKITDDPILKIE
jgi:hypothetical protein